MATKGGLLERLQNGEKIVVAEGYIFNFERRGYLQAGPFVPTVVLDHPELVRELHEEFVNAGSDVVQAFTYYAHREKLKLIGREDVMEKMNRDALRIAKGVAEKTNTLLAGNICNLNLFNISDPSTKEKVKLIFKEQIELAVEEGVDFIIAETFFLFEEAMCALEAVKEYGEGVPCVVTLAPCAQVGNNGELLTLDNVKITEAMKRLEAAGADVVGLNCSSGPETMLSYMERIKKSGVKVPLACLPVLYRTTPKEQIMMELTDPMTDEFVFPVNLDCVMCSRSDIHNFGRRCDELGISYIGLCCGNSAHFTRTLCESIGRVTPASNYSPRMELHCLFGRDEKVYKNHSKNTTQMFDYINHEATKSENVSK